MDHREEAEQVKDPGVQSQTGGPRAQLEHWGATGNARAGRLQESSCRLEKVNLNMEYQH